MIPMFGGNVFGHPDHGLTSEALDAAIRFLLLLLFDFDLNIFVLIISLTLPFPPFLSLPFFQSLFPLEY